MSSARLKLQVLTGALWLASAIVAAGQSDKPSGKPVKSIHDGVLDEIALYVAAPPAEAATAVTMRPFSGMGWTARRWPRSARDESV